MLFHTASQSTRSSDFEYVEEFDDNLKPIAFSCLSSDSQSGAFPRLDISTLKEQSNDLFDSLTSQYRPLQFIKDDEETVLKNWFLPDDYSFQECPYVFKVQRFASGLFEVVCRQIDLPALGRMLIAPRKTGKREQQKEVNQESVLKATARAKKTLRHKIKSMLCDRLATFTFREKDGDTFKTREEVLSAWKYFQKLLKKNGIQFDYVAVLERHKKGNYHIHAAINSYLDVKIVRALWWKAVGGKGQGNIDVSFKHHLSRSSRLRGVAKYVSKYLSKDSEENIFNKKRYMSSRHEMPEKLTFLSNASSLMDALKEARSKFSAHIDSKGDFFPFLDGSGFWLNVNEDNFSPFPF
jgi:hypothetical protein